jgi:hypothetical protein
MSYARCEHGDRCHVVRDRHRARRQLRAPLAAALGSLWMVVAGANDARAQGATDGDHSLPTAAVLSTAGAAGSGADAGLDSAVLAALDKLGVVRVTAQPGMDLGAVQLAVDCVEETTPCLRAVATQTGVQILVAPALERGNDEVVLTLLYFDARGAGELRSVARRQHGLTLEPETLDAVPGMLRELFGLETAAPTPAAVRPSEAPAGEAPPPAATQPGRKLPIGPLILGGAGVLAVAGGIVIGLTTQSAHDDYAKLPVTSKAQAGTASDKLDSGRSQALIANVMYGVGAAAIAAGSLWLALELTHHDRDEAAPRTALLPSLAPGAFGLALVHRGEAL